MTASSAARASCKAVVVSGSNATSRQPLVARSRRCTRCTRGPKMSHRRSISVTGSCTSSDRWQAMRAGLATAAQAGSWRSTTRSCVEAVTEAWARSRWRLAFCCCSHCWRGAKYRTRASDDSVLPVVSWSTACQSSTPLGHGDAAERVAVEGAFGEGGHVRRAAGLGRCSVVQLVGDEHRQHVVEVLCRGCRTGRPRRGSRPSARCGSRAGTRPGGGRRGPHQRLFIWPGARFSA